MAVLVLEGFTASEAIREYLLALGEGYPYGFWKLWRRFKKKTSYKAVRQLFWTLKEIGLIETARWERGTTPFRKHLYRAVPGKEDDVRWFRPQQELYPATALGGSGYAKLKQQGLEPKGGRREQYR